MDPQRRLVGEKVRLGMLREADIDLLIDWDDDGRAARLGDSGPAFPRPEPGQRKVWGERLLRDSVKDFAIRLVDDDTLVGTISLGQIEWSNGVAELGMEIGDPAMWGHGYGTEAVRLLLDFAFNDMNLHRVQLGVFRFNSRAVACYERVGFVREGVQREYLARDGQRHDMLLYGILAPDWRAAQSSG